MNVTQAVYDVLRKLKRRGYRRIGLCLDAKLNARENNGYTMAFLDFQRGIAPSMCIPLLMPLAWNERAFVQWLHKHRPDVVLSTDTQAFEALQTHGFHIPEDIGFVHLRLPRHASSFAGIRFDARLVGAAAVDLVIEQLQRNETGVPAHPETVMIDGCWMEGSTVRNP